MKRGNHSKSRGSKALVLVLAMVLLVGAAIGGTVAWLTDDTQTIENTFTVGNIDIELDEGGAVNNAQSFKMIPGETIAKEPYVTVKANSEPCWVFVQVTEVDPVVTGKTYDFTDFISYNVDTVALGTTENPGIWTPLDGHSGVYYMELPNITTADTTYDILKGDQVTVPSGVTKGMMDDLQSTGATLPKLTFKAYAVQLSSFEGESNVDAAWHQASGTTHPTT